MFGCSKLAQKDYKKRHDTLVRVVHWELCKTYSFLLSDKWYKHSPRDGVTENYAVKLLWDSTNCQFHLHLYMFQYSAKSLFDLRLFLLRWPFTP